jgi:hypothetical protein
MRYKLPLLSALILAVAALGVADDARAVTIETLTLSDVSSEPGTNPAGDLDATFEFSVSDLGDELTLTVTNDTSAPAEYALNEIYFNFNSDVTSIVVSSLPSGWSFATDDCPPGSTTTGVAPCNDMGGMDTRADGFGIYDASIKAGGGDAIAAGDSLAFVFDLTGSGVTAGDFVVEISRMAESGTMTQGLAAAKFIQGPQIYCPPPNDDVICDSAFGTTTPGLVPEPAGLGLLLLGLTGLAVGARRR